MYRFFRGPDLENWMMRSITKRSAPMHFALSLGICVAIFCAACRPPPGSKALQQQQAAEQRTAHALEVARQHPLNLRAFLVNMPKGADLHNHLSGAIYAESWIRDAADDGDCVDLATRVLVARPAAGRPGTASSAVPVACGTGQVSARQAYTDGNLYNELIDAFSMRGFVPTPGTTGHNRFFDTFGKFGAVGKEHTGEWLDEVATRAAAQNEQYLEIMITPPFAKAIELGRTFGWRSESNLSAFRDYLLSNGIKDDVTAARTLIDQAESDRRKIEHCVEAKPAAACGVEIRYLYQILREAPPERVFAQTVAGFETVSADPRWVGINYVQPEDGHISMTDYALHMRMVDFLHQAYPSVHISLHAGELAPGLVPPEGLCCHIRLAVEQAHAERIGHGVDLMYEDHPYDLLREMAAKHVMVEINLTSNDVILGVTGDEHPLPVYRAYGVPVALSTDDEGVSRIDITHEYERAVETYELLKYVDLKQMVRTGIDHSFLPGASLWAQQDHFDHVASACAGDSAGSEKPGDGCSMFLQANEKAREEWELERRFRAFEASH
jgi:adenosine deaminase